MRKTKLATYAVALTLAAAAMTGISTEPAHAEEVTQVVATDTDAAVEDTTEVVIEEAATEDPTTEVEVATDEVTVADEGGDAYYNINENGGSWDGTHYTLNGQVITNAFFCDGIYTYYLQADGTPMKNRLTYHPDGEHVIFFDADGHEVFNDFANVKQSIAGESLDDYCFFDTYGYMYVNKLTYDKDGKNIYYINEYGVMERGKWFQFPRYITYFDIDYPYWMYYEYAYATETGALLTNQFTYNFENKLVYVEGDGRVAKGMMKYVDGIYYLLDANDGRVLEQYLQKPETYTLTEYHPDDNCTVVSTYNDHDDVIASETYDNERNVLMSRYTLAYTYDLQGNIIVDQFDYDQYSSYEGNQYLFVKQQRNSTYDEQGREITRDLTRVYYNVDGSEKNRETEEMESLKYQSGNLFYQKTTNYYGDNSGTQERYYRDDEDNCLSRYRSTSYEQGVSRGGYEYISGEGGKVCQENQFDKDGNITSVRYY